ncbi:DUF4258 domain-containing protein [Endozoicomonas gorgoniicola]|uniref:DUF4258 domain-containing protein n=1 Tax=Endozoicomonas gorgoniicola TaxID=1234144 RepID=A0ABT3N5K1_9GAMM|nr:DUF4258 domain-containing protein [Endozoicomonas gorgoniicola]MCW7551079.1 DUF4258 domain-containing protein [Endozoicomonas gorgoniicola]MCW7556469.1 DUF4258 domain-containing protein [Endozoicomonas gorgoniicola]
MDAKKPLTIKEFPLKPKSALSIVRDLAANHTQHVRFGQHAKERMLERGVSNRQVFDVLRSRHSYITESPCQTPRGSWKFNLMGFSSGDTIELVIDVRRPEDRPGIYLVTVIVK